MILLKPYSRQNRIDFPHMYCILLSICVVRTHLVRLGLFCLQTNITHLIFVLHVVLAFNRFFFHIRIFSKNQWRGKSYENWRVKTRIVNRNWIMSKNWWVNGFSKLPSICVKYTYRQNHALGLEYGATASKESH